MKTKVGSDHTPGTIYHIPFGKMGDGYMTVADSGCIPVLYQVTADINGRKNSRTYVAKWINMKQALPEKLPKPVSIVTTRQFPHTRRSENGPVVTIGPEALRYPHVSFVSSQGFSKSGSPDVLKLFHRHSVWMIRIFVLVKVNGIRHYSFIDLILPCFSHK
jgi:hypothetical protein